MKLVQYLYCPVGNSAIMGSNNVRMRGNTVWTATVNIVPWLKARKFSRQGGTPLILRELLRGSTGFNEIHRGVPRMSRTLLSNRLRKLETCGVLERRDGERGHEYHLTPAGRDLGPVVTHLGTWAQRWFRTEFVEHELDAGVLMWDIRCTLDPNTLTDSRTAVQFVFTDVPKSTRCWWLINDNGQLDMCPIDPGVEVGMIIRTTLEIMTRVWMGDIPLATAARGGKLEIVGSPRLKGRFEKCFCLSPYARVPDGRKELRGKHPLSKESLRP